MNIQMMDPRKLVPYEKNVKIHTKEQLQGIAKMLQINGKVVWDQPIVVDKDLVIIKGHGRTMTAIEVLNLPLVPVLVRDDLTPEQVRAARLGDNRVAMTGIDTEMLRDELSTLNFDLSGIFDPKELEFSTVDLGAMNMDAFVADVDAAVIEQEAEAKVKADEIANRRVALAKVFGFKDVSGANELHLNRFLAYVEAQTGLQGEEALVKFAKQTLELV